MDIISLRAYAKINLALDVLSRRPDGYHEVKMVMQTIGLHDKLDISASDTPGIYIQSNAPYLPAVQDNIIYKAAKLFLETYKIDSGVNFRLDKKIPVAAGMAGGSTDAAAALIGLDRLFGTKLSDEELRAIGKQVGADVPYCLMGGTAVAQGIGEKLTRLPDAPKLPCIIVKPPVSVSTKTVYEGLRLGEASAHPDVDAMIKAIESSDAKAICSGLGNILETVTIPLHPEIAQIKQMMLELGADGTLMSGSGPTVFGLFENKKQAEKAYYEFKISEWGKQTYLTELSTGR